MVKGDDYAKVRWAFETAYGRVPENDLVQEAVAFVSTYRKQQPDQISRSELEIAGWSALARVLLTSNAFLFVD